MEQQHRFPIGRSFVQVVHPQLSTVARVDVDVARFEREVG
jgi:hypothetical protein